MRINHASGYIEEKGVNKYLLFDSTDENKDLLKEYNHVFDGIRGKIKEVSSGKCNYGKDYMKIKFNSGDDLALNKPLKFGLMTITIRSVFEEDGKRYPQVFLDDTLYKLNMLECLNTTELIFMLIKQVCQKNVIFVTIGILKILVLSMNHIFAMVVMI